MLFNSHVFLLLFLPVVLLLWWSPRASRRTRLGMLTAASYLFYGYWDARFTALMLLSTLIDYGAGLSISRETNNRRRRGWLLVSLVSNLSLLGFFKYAGFFASSTNAVASAVAGSELVPVLEIILPVGISFYTFQSMSYSIDIYRRDARPTRSFLDFAAYVSMFPQLIAGPIVRYRDLDDQIRSIPEKPSAGQFRSGFRFFVVGMAKKVLVADLIASRLAFERHETFGLLDGWANMLGYTAQIYYDFSGYSDMAVGLGLFLGFRFPQNFNSPYKASDISDFWRRWHISLSEWLRDYLYIPLGGSKHGRAATLRNLVITMFLGGLWHGAAWNFVLWGLYHGCLLVIFHTWRRAKRPLPRPLAIGLTFLAVVGGWVLFRSESLDMAGSLFATLAGVRGLGTAPLPLLGMTIAALLWALFAPNVWDVRVKWSFGKAVLAAALLALCTLRFTTASPFLYFQF